MSEETLHPAATAVPEQEQATAPESVNTEASQEAEQEPRTFTQEELDKIVAERAAKIERKLRREMVREAEEVQRPVAPQPPDPRNFENLEQYADALADYKAEQKLAEREYKQQAATIDQTYAEREEDARAKYDDFERVAYNPNLRVTAEMAATIKASEIGPEVIYYLGSNPKEAARIAGLSPLLQAKEIGKIEASLSANPPAKKVSSAPDPIKPVGSRASSPTYDVTDPRSVKSMSDAEWIEARNRQLAKKYAQ